ncbi:hypothetical protein J3R30DRAFT_857784 [Lentinula aciculospora]|uniref:Uncharacterized protein n=1 Tax=Lentinula aciculospora TaxID=153920 RepID=A0A9W9AQ23_9AGAR|nr:hypothetical protein J3R30DRAFT_857784 [Lentinula aciculospora]
MIVLRNQTRHTFLCIIHKEELSSKFQKSVEQTNQGIVDGRPEGQQPEAASITLDTVVNKDASLSDPQHSSVAHTFASRTLNGATSADVHDSIGKPGSGMSSKELHHDGQAGRKNPQMGEMQWQK